MLTTSRATTLLGAVLFITSAVAALAFDSSTLTGRVICGYQGWFRTPTDGMSKKWTHYGDPIGSTIEFWPDMSELAPEERFVTTQKLADGTPAELFSSVIPATVARHFEWMQTYGIDGAFLQRFATGAIARNGKPNNALASLDRVLTNVRSGAQQHERTWAVMYDLSGLKAGEMTQVMADWRHLVDNLGVRKDDGSYQHHRGRPVVAVWGLGFNDARSYTVAEVGELVKFLKNDPVYGGNTVLLGVPTFWRTGRRDAVADPQLLEVIAQADIVQPWLVNRFSKPEDATGWVEQHMREDLAWCNAHQLDYMPVLFPGFRWTNHDAINPARQNKAEGLFVWATAEVPRLGGRFLWAQFVAAQRAGATLFYQAMFDEVDEGTAIFKCTNNVPVPNNGLSWQTYEGLPSDHYLKLIGTAAQSLRANRPLPEQMPDLTAPSTPPRETTSAH